MLYKHSISYFKPIVQSSTPIAYKDSSKVSSKTLQRRSNFVKKELSICSGNDGTKNKLHTYHSHLEEVKEKTTLNWQIF